MRAPRGGLRPLHNKSNGVAKVDLRIAAGSTLEVSDEVAAQLLATGAFAEGEAPAPAEAAEDAAEEAPAEAAEDAAEEAPAEAKRARRPKG